MSASRVIDFHTHAFPDALADRAIQALLAEAPGVTAHHGGKVADLIASMDEAGIETSVLCSIATKPAQFEPILQWSKQVRSDRVIPFPSFHPQDNDFKERIRVIKGEGFKGVKFHPYYQEFHLDDDRMLHIFEEIQEHDLMVVMHTGYDIAFERIRLADPARIVKVHELMPELKLITTHLGAWQQWDEVRQMILGKKIYMEISFALEFLGDELKEFVQGHPEGYVLFGSDAPWTPQRANVERVRKLGLTAKQESDLLYGNAMKLLTQDK